MKGQNIKKYYQKELNLMCKTDEKTRNYIISLPHDKMSHRSWENWLCENELIIDFGGQKWNQIQNITANIWEINEK